MYSSLLCSWQVPMAAFYISHLKKFYRKRTTKLATDWNSTLRAGVCLFTPLESESSAFVIQSSKLRIYAKARSLRWHFIHWHGKPEEETHNVLSHLIALYCMMYHWMHTHQKAIINHNHTHYNSVHNSTEKEANQALLFMYVQFEFTYLQIWLNSGPPDLHWVTPGPTWTKSSCAQVISGGLFWSSQRLYLPTHPHLPSVVFRTPCKGKKLLPVFLQKLEVMFL